MKYVNLRKRGNSRQVLKRAELYLGPKKCSWKGCSRVVDIELHHIDGNALNNDPSNHQWLCKRHHKMAHRKISWEDILMGRDDFDMDNMLAESAAKKKLLELNEGGFEYELLKERNAGYVRTELIKEYKRRFLGIPKPVWSKNKNKPKTEQRAAAVLANNQNIFVMYGPADALTPILQTLRIG